MTIPRSSRELSHSDPVPLDLYWLSFTMPYSMYLLPYEPVEAPDDTDARTDRDLLVGSVLLSVGLSLLFLTIWIVAL
jgi:hypothetical protein